MTRMKIEWQHVYVRLTLTYGVSSGRNFDVLSDMCGEMEEGLLAVMGPSGCGKTTFLRMLAGCVPSGSITAGYVHYNGKERNIDQWLNNIAYVGQNDVIYKYMSARDHVVYSALFNRKKIRNLKQKIKLLFDRLDITKLMHKKMDKLSNGQRKRVLIAMELIKEPDIVIMDEPTSGLDNTSAFYLVQFLKEYALSGRIVICSIHQPDERTINVFDKILVLNTGHTVFLGKKETCEELLRQNKIVRSPFMSFSTHMMELCWSENDGFYDVNSMLRLCEIFNENQLKYSKSTDRIPHFKSKDDFYLNMWINPYHIFLLLKRSMHARFSEKSALVYIAIYNTPLPVFILFEKFYLRSDKLDFAALDALARNPPNLQQQLEDIIGYCNEFAHYTDQAYRFTIMLISTSIMYLGISDLPRVCNELALNRYSIVSYYFGSMLDGLSVFIPPTTIGLLSMNVFVDAIFDMRFVFLSILFILHACIYMYFFQNLFKGPIGKLVMSCVCVMLGSISQEFTGYLSSLKRSSIVYCIVQGILGIFIPSSLYVNAVMRILFENQICMWLSKCPHTKHVLLPYFMKYWNKYKNGEPYGLNTRTYIYLVCFSIFFSVIAGIVVLWKTIYPSFRMRLSKR